MSEARARAAGSPIPRFARSDDDTSFQGRRASRELLASAGFEEAAVATSELVDRGLRKIAIHRLNAHHLPLLSIDVGLERPTILGRDQQQSPGIAGAEDDLVYAVPGHGMSPETVADPKAVRIGADIAACESHHPHDGQRQNAEQGQSLGQREQHPNLRGEQEPANGCQQAEGKRCDDRYHPHSVRSRDVHALVETVVSHWSRH